MDGRIEVVFLSESLRAEMGIDKAEVTNTQELELRALLCAGDTPRLGRQDE